MVEHRSTVIVGNDAVLVTTEISPGIDIASPLVQERLRAARKAANDQMLTVSVHFDAPAQ